MKVGNKVYFDIGNHRRLGYIIKINKKTVQVKMMLGAKTKVNIKRHIYKHGVVYYDGFYDEFPN